MRWLSYLGLIAPAVVSSAAVPMTRPRPPMMLPDLTLAATAIAATGHGARRSLVLDRSVDGLFYVEALVNGTPVRFVVDTGSSVVVLNAQDAARTGVGTTEAMHVDTAGGATSMKRAQIKRVSLAGQTLNDVEAAVVGRNLEVSLLGQSALSQLMSVTLRAEQLELQGRGDGERQIPPA